MSTLMSARLTDNIVLSLTRRSFASLDSTRVAVDKFRTASALPLHRGVNGPQVGTVVGFDVRRDGRVFVVLSADHSSAITAAGPLAYVDVLWEFNIDLFTGASSVCLSHAFLAESSAFVGAERLTEA